MQAVSIAHWKRRNHFAGTSCQNYHPAAAIRSPKKRIHHCAPLLQQLCNVEQIGAQIEDGIVPAQTEVVYGARIFQRYGPAVTQTFTSKAIEIEPRGLRRKKNAKVEHFTRSRIELGVS